MKTETLERLAVLVRHVRIEFENVDYWLRREGFKQAVSDAVNRAFPKCDAIAEILRNELLVAPPERLHSHTEGT